jgi:hypothetical protein
MSISNIEDLLSLVSADASSIQILITEVSEILELNSSDYFKLHAAYELAESQIRRIESIENQIIELRQQLK